MSPEPPETSPPAPRPSTSVSAVGSQGISAAQLTGAGGCGLDKELVSATFGTVWSIVSFVDLGVEYAYGHRQGVRNVKGDVNALVSRFTVRF